MLDIFIMQITFFFFLLLFHLKSVRSCLLLFHLFILFLVSGMEGEWDLNWKIVWSTFISNMTRDFCVKFSWHCSFLTFSDTPDAPGVPEITEIGGDFVSLTWEKPKSDGGGKIKSYWVDKREHGHDNWTRVNMQLCLTNILNIPNLIEDKRYEFRVFAENEAGMSKPSMNSQTVKIKDPKGTWVNKYSLGLEVGGMVFNTTFNNISVISWQSVLLVEETRVPRENHRPAASHWQTLSHNVVSSTPRLIRIQTHNFSDDMHWLHR